MEKNDEIWRDIEGYEGLYQISNLGRIKRVARASKNKGTYGSMYQYKEKILSPQENKRRFGYYEISLHKNKKEKRFKIHRLVACAFVPNPNNKPEVNHIDGDKRNNKATNLEWVTSSENKKHAWNHNLYNSDHRKKAIICNNTNTVYESVTEASIQLNCDRRSIHRVLKGEKDKVKGMSFSYAKTESFQ